MTQDQRPDWDTQHVLVTSSGGAPRRNRKKIRIIRISRCVCKTFSIDWWNFKFIIDFFFELVCLMMLKSSRKWLLLQFLQWIYTETMLSWVLNTGHWGHRWAWLSSKQLLLVDRCHSGEWSPDSTIGQHGSEQLCVIDALRGAKLKFGWILFWKARGHHWKQCQWWQYWKGRRPRRRRRRRRRTRTGSTSRSWPVRQTVQAPAALEVQASGSSRAPRPRWRRAVGRAARGPPAAAPPLCWRPS